MNIMYISTKILITTPGSNLKYIDTFSYLPISKVITAPDIIKPTKAPQNARLIKLNRVKNTSPEKIPITKDLRGLNDMIIHPIPLDIKNMENWLI